MISSLSLLLAVATAVERFDVVVYGGTSGGVAAAVQAAKMSKSVALVEPSRHLGGLSSGGLGATDMVIKAPSAASHASSIGVSAGIMVKKKLGPSSRMSPKRS